MGVLRRQVIVGTDESLRRRGFWRGQTAAGDIDGSNAWLSRAIPWRTCAAFPSCSRSPMSPRIGSVPSAAVGEGEIGQMTIDNPRRILTIS
jgi:hypothetical protein